MHQSFLQEFAVKILGEVVRETQQLWQFEINAIVLLPGHLHAIWTLPPDDSNFSKRWAWLQKGFTKKTGDVTSKNLIQSLK